jgi:hypothetical protein
MSEYNDKYLVGKSTEQNFVPDISDDEASAKPMVWSSESVRKAEL